ncbi:GtrA family protein [Effusibacillus pohliae]|uniref:GtrA family protein n=1 Tax=Effusibacillus pohliae TaxID=232270 RepID=UPI00037409D3|nr:GtrA family protein [Effusibacillus pohliae]
MNHSFARFLLVGVLNTLVGLSSTYLLLNAVGLNYWWSTFLGNSIGAVCSYFLNRSFTFRSDVSIKSSFWKFALVILTCYAISYWLGLLLSSLLLSVFGRTDNKIVENLAVLVSTGVYTVTNYLGQRFFAFRQKPGAAVFEKN